MMTHLIKSCSFTQSINQIDSLIVADAVIIDEWFSSPLVIH